MVKRIIPLLILLVVLFFGIFYYLTRFSIKNVSDQTHQVFDWKVPELPQGYDWIQSNATDTEMEDNRMFFDDRYFVGNGSPPVSSGEMKVPGKIYKASVKDTDSAYNSAGFNLNSKLDSILVKNGWEQGVQFGDYEIMGMAASGVQGNSIGYVKLDGNLIRTFVYGYINDGNWIQSNDEPIHLECPCVTKMTIFIGDPVDLRNYIHN